MSEVKRFDLLNHLIDTYKFEDYLEIGIFSGECIRNVKAKNKDGVDPGYERILVPEVNFPIDSDRYFEFLDEDKKYDLIFIDGLHHADQVKRDINNSLNHLSDNGIIMMHDCNPQTKESQIVPRQISTWHGDVWKAYVEFKYTHPQFSTYVVDTDCGCGVILNNKDKSSIPLDLELNYENLVLNRNEWLNLISVNEFKNIFK